MGEASAEPVVYIVDDSSDTEGSQSSKKPRLEDSYNDEGSICLICYEVWGQSGEHRISSLRCGHLFGKKCILRWLHDNKVCPTCKKHATKRDVRYIYANKLIALDNCELIRIQGELDELKGKKQLLDMELIDLSCKLTMAQKEIEMYKLQMRRNHLKARSTLVEPSFAVDPTFALQYSDGYLVCPQGSCRVMDYMPSKRALMASLKSPNHLFPGFGVRQFNAETFAPLMYTPLHAKVIRDVKFNPCTSSLLSVSIDKSFCITYPFSNDCVIKQPCDDMLWSCCWDSGNSNIFYIGGQQGSIKVYDMRNISTTALHTYSIPGDFSPVVSVVSTPSAAGAAMPLGGFVAAKLNSLWAFEATESEHQSHLLPIEGPFVSLSYDIVDNHLLVSVRPNNKEPTARDILCRLTRDSGAVSCQRIHSFTSGRVQKHLVRSRFIYRDKGKCIATPNDCNLQVWDAQTGYMIAAAKTPAMIMDILPLNIATGELLISLTEKKLQVFKVIDNL